MRPGILGQSGPCTEGIVTWLRALRPKAERISGVIPRETARVNRTADALEVVVTSGGFSGPMNAVQIVFGSGVWSM